MNGHLPTASVQAKMSQLVHSLFYSPKVSEEQSGEEEDGTKEA